MLIGAVALLSVWAVVSVDLLRGYWRDIRYLREITTEKSQRLGVICKANRDTEAEATKVFGENLTLKAQNEALQQQLSERDARIAAAEAALKTPPMTDHFKD